MSSTEYIMNTYSRFPITLTHGEGMYVYDENGKKYLDFAAGIAVNSLGHGHKGLAEAISRQAGELIHVSNLYWNKPQIELAEKLVKNSCFDKVFFCNSGAESIEGALKLARKYASKKGTGKFEIITMKDSFHGRTYGAITATGQTKYQKGLEPLLPGIVHAEFNSYEGVKAAVTDKTCAILLEPVQGESGIHPADKDFLEKVRSLCDKNDILLIFDEVQCGVGRTGELFAYQQYGVEPDILTLAKGLAGGVPIGALLAKSGAAEGFSPGDHASTFGGNPLAAAAANTVLDEVLGGLLGNAKKQGEYLAEKLKMLVNEYDIVAEVRGIGLMQGIELTVPAGNIVNACIEKGLLLVSAGPNVVRFVPPLIVTGRDIDEAVDILRSALGA